MKKSDAMVALKKEDSRKKKEQVLSLIDRMKADGELVTVAALRRKTGLSRAYFYNNSEIARKRRQVFTEQEKEHIQDRRNTVLNQNLQRELERTRKELEKVKRKCEKYEAELAQMDKEIQKRDQEFLRNLKI